MADRAELIRKIYKNSLGRNTVDAPGLAYWQTRGDLSDVDLERQIAGAGNANEARRDEINRIYYQSLGRTDPDQAGLDYWMGRTDLTGDALRQQMIGASPMAGVNSNGLTASIMQDQSYASFLRGHTFNESQIQSRLAAANDAAARQISGQRPVWEQSRKVGLQGVDQNYESRGMFRSGGRLNSRNEVNANVDLQKGQFEGRINDANAQNQRDSADAIAAGRRENVEQQMAARTRLTQGSVQV